MSTADTAPAVQDTVVMPSQRSAEPLTVPIGTPVRVERENRSQTAYVELVHLVAAYPGLADRLLAAHRDDGHSRCTAIVCGAHRLAAPWPCSLVALALLALRTEGEW